MMLISKNKLQIIINVMFRINKVFVNKYKNEDIVIRIKFFSKIREGKVIL